MAVPPIFLLFAALTSRLLLPPEAAEDFACTKSGGHSIAAAYIRIREIEFLRNLSEPNAILVGGTPSLL
jgi:hypothetical protein